MGTDKAFLKFGERSFISIIVDKALEISNDVVLAVGAGSREASFRHFLTDGVRIVCDLYNTESPVSGILSAFENITNDYSVVVACDMPLLEGNVLSALHEKAVNHDAAVPIWENGDIEPLGAVYRVATAREIALSSLKNGPIGPRNLVLKLPDVRYVKVSELRRFDRNLVSFTNVNTEEEYEELTRVKHS